MTLSSMPLYGAMASPLLSSFSKNIALKASADFVNDDPKVKPYRTTPSRDETVTAMNRIQGVRKEETGNENSRIETMDNILFVYNFRGDLSINFMNSLNKVIYKTSSVSFLQTSEFGTSVDIQV